MLLLMTFARWGVIVLVTGFAAITFYRLLAARLRLDGLLRSRDGAFSPGRAQLLVLTIFTAVQYLMRTIQNPSHLPALPSIFVIALGGSQAIYLGAKAWSAFRPKRSRLEEK